MNYLILEKWQESILIMKLYMMSAKIACNALRLDILYSANQPMPLHIASMNFSLIRNCFLAWNANLMSVKGLKSSSFYYISYSYWFETFSYNIIYSSQQCICIFYRYKLLRRRIHCKSLEIVCILTLIPFINFNFLKFI